MLQIIIEGIEGRTTFFFHDKSIVCQRFCTALISLSQKKNSGEDTERAIGVVKGLGYSVHRIISAGLFIQKMQKWR